MKRSITIIALLAWPLFLNDLYLIPLGNTRLGLLWTLDLVFFVGIPSITLVFLVKTGRLTLQEIGLAYPPRPRSILAGLALCALLVLVIHWNFRPWIRSIFPWRLFPGYDFPPTQPLRGYVIAYAAITTGVLEELIYRGVVISQMRKAGRSAAFAVIVSCAVFAGIHWGEGPAKLIWTALWGLIPAIWFVRTRTIWGPITCHTTYIALVWTGTV